MHTDDDYDYDYDAIIVGARCAGASLAMLLARQGHRVLLIDRARLPSDIPHGHFIHRHGPPRLARWGLLEAIVASGCPPTRTQTSYLGDFRLSAHNLELDGVAWGYGPRRAVLDRILVEAAVAAGAELMTGVAVEDLLTDGDRVVGVRTARSTPIRARLTIGADGKHSRVAQAVQAPVEEHVPTLTCWYFSYFRDVPEVDFEMHVLPQRRVIFAHRTNDDLLAVFIGWPIDEYPSVRADIEASFFDVLDRAPWLGERVRAGRRTERFSGTGDLPNVVRRPYGAGWALVGDAGCHKDPFGALGVCDALRDAELLAGAAHTGLAGEQPLAAALAGYGRQRNAATLPDFRENLHLASFAPVPPDVLRLRQALADQPAEATRFVLAKYGRQPASAEAQAEAGHFHDGGGGEDGDDAVERHVEAVLGVEEQVEQAEQQRQQEQRPQPGGATAAEHQQQAHAQAG
jgi:flavin-dependent dehydrogenase